MNETPFRILGIPGSLRRHSYNRGLLKAAQQVAPAGVDIEVSDLADIPLYNSDVEAIGEPLPVREFKDRVRAADALLIATPEYNYSIPGVLKNAIDWASRPPSAAPIARKPIAIMGASSGHYGTVRAQLALRQCLASFGALVLVKPELHVFNAGERFDAEGNLTDSVTLGKVQKLVEALVAWTQRLRG
ncbi:MAG: NAD(P)H-dependent oxidoreductase [Chloroflexi bacterium]|nr:NAD(P)H-dependent oxidoreductase [Chloroflexota bacterium]